MKKLVCCSLSSLIGILVLLLFSFSCTSKKQVGGVAFSNDFENEFGWHDTPILTKGDAHSGQYFDAVGPNGFSTTFKKRFSDIGINDPEKIKLSAWVKFPVLDSRASLVVSIDSAEGKPSFFWQSIAVEDFIDSKDSWFKVEGEIELPKDIKPNYSLLVYVMNGCRKTILVDDLAFELNGK